MTMDSARRIKTATLTDPATTLKTADSARGVATITLTDPVVTIRSDSRRGTSTATLVTAALWARTHTTPWAPTQLR